MDAILLGRVERPFHKGDRFETTRDLTVPALVHWRAPMTSGFDAKLPAGLVVVALKDAEDDWQTYPGLPALPEDHEEWEARLVSRSDLALKDEPRGYDGFHLSFQVGDIGDALLPVEGRGRLAWSWD